MWPCAYRPPSVPSPGYATRKAHRLRHVLLQLQYAGGDHPAAQAEGGEDVEGLQEGQVLRDVQGAQADQTEGGETFEMNTDAGGMC